MDSLENLIKTEVMSFKSHADLKLQMLTHISDLAIPLSVINDKEYLLAEQNAKLGLAYVFRFYLAKLKHFADKEEVKMRIKNYNAAWGNTMLAGYATLLSQIVLLQSSAPFVEIAKDLGLSRKEFETLVSEYQVEQVKSIVAKT